MEKYLYAALFAPFVGALFSFLFTAQKKNVITALVTSGLLLISFVSSLTLMFAVHDGLILHVKMMDWISAGNLSLPYGFIVDNVSVVMMVTVTLVSSIVNIYSMGYMMHDKGYNRFFTYISMFVFSMLVLVMSDNFAGLFIGWEGVGLCSYLLIGFWYEKQSATWAGNEAFIMNRVADLGMLMGLFLIYWQFGKFNYDEIFAHVGSVNTGIVTSIGLLLFIGAMGKSAQFPFHTWLADAMEGPTPVSALIHAATMVTAGVYLVIRASNLFSLVPEVGHIIATLGAFVAVFAASMALVHRDLKKIIAYSTLSQLGYMFVAAGLGAYWIALFHLMTHAFFKSLLFLGAGNIMHAMDDELDIKKMGGLASVMPYTAILMAVASVALCGVYPFAGFFSKDAILAAAFNGGNFYIWFTLFIGAGMTAFYSFRLIMLVFFGDKVYKKLGFHPHETYPFVLWALLPLGILSTIAGFFEHPFEEFVTKILGKYEFTMAHSTQVGLIFLTSAFVIIVIVATIYKYAKGGFSKQIETLPLYILLKNQYYIPKIYEEVIFKPYYALSRFAWKQIDVRIIDFTVDLIARTLYKTGQESRKMQSGNLSDMLRWMVVGIVVLLALAIFYRPMM